MRTWLPLIAATLLFSAPGYADDKSRSETIIAGDYFGAGGSLEPGVAVEGDAFVAGGQVALRVPVGGDAVLAGGSINVAERVGGDLYAGGGSVSIDAAIAHNARVAGGRVHLTRRGRVDGKATLSGATIEIEGDIGRQLTAFGESVTLDGVVRGDVTVAARKLNIGPSARIDGRLTYRGPAPATVHPQAVIRGGVNYLLFRIENEKFEPMARAIAWAGAAAFTSGLFLVGLLGIVLLPQLTAGTAGMVRNRPFSSLGLGFALVVCVPVAAILIMATVIGIPLGFALLFLYPVLLMLGYLTGIMSVSDGIAGMFSRGVMAGRIARIALLAVAMIGVLLLAYVPLAGWIVGPLLMFAGAGAIVLRVFGAR